MANEGWRVITGPDDHGEAAFVRGLLRGLPGIEVASGLADKIRERVRREIMGTEEPEVDVSMLGRVTGDGEETASAIQDAIDNASDQDRTTWITDKGRRIAAIVPVDYAEDAARRELLAHAALQEAKRLAQHAADSANLLARELGAGQLQLRTQRAPAGLSPGLEARHAAARGHLEAARDRLRARSCPSCHSIGPVPDPAGGCTDPWHGPDRGTLHSEPRGDGQDGCPSCGSRELAFRRTGTCADAWHGLRA